MQSLAQEFAPTHALTGDPLDDVDLIESQARQADRHDEFLKYLDDIFHPERRAGCDLTFHRRLVSLGFCGLATTNFDTALEQACAVDAHGCEPIELGDPLRRYEVFRFLRGLQATDHHSRVLHVHGVHTSPGRLILGAKSFAKAYGHEIQSSSSALETLPRKVLWTLLATRSVVFVGFGLTDRFLRKTIDLVNEDLFLTDEPAHFAILPLETDAFVHLRGVEFEAARHAWEREKAATLPKAIVPIFYDALGDDHSALDSLVSRIGKQLGVQQPSFAIDSLLERTLEER